MRAYATIIKWLVSAVAVIVIGALAWWTSPQWLPHAKQWVSVALEPPNKKDKEDEGKAHTGQSQTIALSPQARLNIGLKKNMVQAIKLETFTRTITVPAVVAGRPGKTKVKVVSPMTGVITDVFAIQGESIAAGQPLFKIRLIHEDLVKAQTDYLKTLGALDVEEKEIRRLAKLTREGALAGKELLAREYEKHKLEALLRAQHESLLLHSLTEMQIQAIKQSRKLKSDFVIYAPSVPADLGEIKLGIQPVTTTAIQPKSANNGNVPRRRFVVRDLKVTKGDFIQAGGTLTVLADYSNLYIQGRAFEQDTDEMIQARKNGWKVTAVLEDNKRKSRKIEGLNIVFLDHEVESDSRAFHFYVDLPNEVASRNEVSTGHSFVTWRFKPGQRMQLLVPVEKWEKRIVLPADAVAKEGAEYYVFVENGGHLDRRPVHVEYRDQFNVVIANDGSVFPGDRVAYTGAHQLQIALKNQAGGGVDPHAGCSHH